MICWMKQKSWRVSAIKSKNSQHGIKRKLRGGEEETSVMVSFSYALF